MLIYSAHDSMNCWCFLWIGGGICGFVSSAPTVMSQSTVRSEVYAHKGFQQLLGTEHNAASDTNDDRGKHRHVFEIKVVFGKDKLTRLPPPLSRPGAGSLLNPWAFVPSERPYSQGFMWAEFTRWDH